MTRTVEDIVQFFETLTAQDVVRCGAFYTADAYFKDPFQEVRGLAQVQRIYAHMFATLSQPRFVVTTRVVQGNQCFLVWEFKFYFKSFRADQEQTVRGTSHLQLAEDGRIAVHRDYWDASEEVYEKLPLLGGLMRWLKRRARA